MRIKTDRSFRRVLAKLAEARFFYGLLARSSEPEKAAYYFSAFASAARSVTFTMQAVMDSTPGFETWYEAERTVMAQNVVARFLLEARNETQKVGISPVHSAGVGTSLSSAGRFHCSVVYRFTALDGGADPPKEHVVSACRTHLGSISALVRRCYDQFKATIDPTGGLEVPLRQIETAPKVRTPQCPLDRAMHRRLGTPYRAALKDAAAKIVRARKARRSTKKPTRPGTAG
jgi:hypothetical protein